MEAPFLRIDPILEAFARRHGCEIVRNYRGAERSLHFRDALSRSLWIHTMDKYGADGLFQVSAIAHVDRNERHLKAVRVGDPVGAAGLERMMERATEIAMTWTEADMAVPRPLRDRGETERVY